MSKNQDPKVTIFKNILQTTGGDDFSLADILSAIKTGHWRDKIESLRAIENKAERSDFKKNNLPYFTGSGTFEKRSNNSIVEHNGRVVLDFDAIDDVNDAKSLLCSDQFVEYCFISASGNGLAVIIKIDPNKHDDSFQSAKEYFEKKYSYKIDPLRDVSRARFVSYDPDMFHNPNSRVFLIQRNISDKIKNVISGMISRAPEGERHNQVLKCSRLAGGFISGGILDEYEIEQFIVDEVTRNGFRTAVHLQTIKDGINNGKLSPLQISDAERINVESDSDRKNWAEIYSFIHSVNRAGRRFGEMDIVHICEKYLISREKITAAFEKVFREHADEFDIDNKPEIVRVEIFIRKNWEIVKNEVTGISEFREHGAPHFEPLNINTIYRNVQHNGFKFSFEKLRSLLKSDFIQIFNPFVDYFESLPTWAGEHDYIDQLASHVKIRGGNEAQTFFQIQFKKHLVRSIGCTLDGAENRFVFVFIGENQNTGKSTFIRFLNPFGSKYYTEQPIRDNKDTEISFAENFIHNLEELSSLGKADVNHLKSIISRAVIKERKPYQETAVDLPRRVNFWASTNKDEFLTDTINTRWLCFDVESIDWGYKKDVKINDVWSQSFTLYKNGFDFQLTKDESETRDNMNKKYEVSDLEKDVISRFFIPAPALNSNFKPNSEIMELMIKLTDNKLKLNSWNLSKSLKQLGFISDRKEMNGHRTRGFYLIQTQPATAKDISEPIEPSDLPF